MDRSNVGAVGQWGVPHCEQCGSELEFWGRDDFKCVIGEILVWICVDCDDVLGAYELVTETGYPVAAYVISPYQTEGEVWDWLVGGWVR